MVEGYSDRQSALTDAYFDLRRESESLRKESWRFEGQRFSPGGDDTIYRPGIDGSELHLYWIDDGIEASITFPDGTSKTYA